MPLINSASENNAELIAKDLVDQGLKQHQQGNLDEAAMLYQSAIQQDNHQSDALHLLGMIAFQLNQADKAEQLILLAIQNNPDVAIYHNNLGNVYLANALVEKAIDAYRHAVVLKSNYAEARFNLGNAYLEYGDLGLAEIFFLRALEVAPDFTLALKNLGELYVAQYKWQEAKQCYESLHEMEPENLEISQRLSDLLTVVDAEEAERISNLRRALTLNSNNLDACLSLANLYYNRNEINSAEKLYKQALQIDSQNVSALFGHAGVSKSEEKFEECIKIYLQIIEIDPQHIDAIFNLANTYKALAELQLAEKYYQLILDQAPQHFGALVNLGVIKTWEGQFQIALEYLQKAELVNPESYILQNNLGMTHHFLRNFEMAKKHYYHALKIEDNPEAKWNLSLTLLTEGNLKQGFVLYESRWELPGLLSSVKRELVQPLWQGESLNQKTILVYFEQGYGDAIQFARFLPELLKTNTKVIFEVPPSLYRLMQKLHPDIKIVKSIDEAGDFDFHCPIMSLPFRLGLTLDSISSFIVPYLNVDKKSDLIEIGKLDNAINVGIVWSGNPREHDIQTHMIDRRRSCSVDLFENLTDIKNTRWFNLQKEEMLPVSSNITNVMQSVKDFEDTAEIINQLDLIISVDTAVAHLGGAMSKPVWLLSRYDACWRWLNGRLDSPWYPTMRIFQQSSPGDWGSVFSQVRNALLDFSVKN